MYYTHGYNIPIRYNNLYGIPKKIFFTGFRIFIYFSSPKHTHYIIRVGILHIIIYYHTGLIVFTSRSKTQKKMLFLLIRPVETPIMFTIIIHIIQLLQ